MRKRILSVLLGVCMLVCLVPGIQVSAINYILDKSYWQRQWINLQRSVRAVKTSPSVPVGTQTFDLNESRTVLGYIQEGVCYISPARPGDIVALPEDSSSLFEIVTANEGERDSTLIE